MQSFNRFISNNTLFSTPIKKLALAVIGSLPALAFAAPGATSAYVADPQHSYVEDATSKGIGQVNMITCIMSAMAPDQLVNKGDSNGNYVALVDQGKCDPNSRSSSSNSGSTNAGSQAANYMTATVHSTRASNSDPMLVNIWIDDSSGDGSSQLIFVHTAATAAPTTTNPYGIFRLDFCGKGVNGQGQLSPSCMMNGYLDGSSTGLSYYQTEDRGNQGVNTTALRLNATSTDSGSGKLSITENNVSSTFSFDYNHDYFLRGDGTNPSQCFSRDANVANASVWRYGVYDADTGARVTRNSGFPIEYTPLGGGTTYHGYLGYWGVSLPAAAANALQTNDTVQKVDYNGGQAQKVNYTVVKAAGKLTKYTKHTRTLDQIDKIKLNVFVGDATGFFNGASNYTQYEVYWDDTNGVFKVDGQIDCNGGNGCQTAAITPEKSVNASFWVAQNGLQGWSQSLGGEVFIDFHTVSGAVDHSNSNTITVAYRSQDIVYPADMPSNLYCLRDCPTQYSIDTYFQVQPGQHQPSDSPFTLPNQWAGVNAGSEAHYTTNPTTALLLDGGAHPVMPTNQSALQQDPQYQQGLRSGRLFTDLNAVVCDNNGNQYCDYKVNDLQTYYVWETGPNSWNQFVAVKDSNNQFVAFDAPLQIPYTVPNGAAYGEYAGTSIVLQYGGFGDLSGIPGHCVSHLTNATVSCNAQGEDVRYVPAFVIPAGAQVSDGTHNYLVKWLEREIRFASVNPTTFCSNLNLPNNIVLPTAAGLTDPSATLGAKPTVTDAPRVIQGDVKF